MDDFEVDGTIYRREGPFDDMLREERRKAFLSLASPPQRKPRKPRKPPLASVIKEFEKAGKSVCGAVIEGNRTELRFGEPEPTPTTNP